MIGVDHRFTRLEQNTDNETIESTSSKATAPHVKDNQYILLCYRVFLQSAFKKDFYFAEQWEAQEF